MKLIVAISGASGASLGLKFVDVLSKIDNISVYVVQSESSRVVLNKEENIHIYKNKDISAPIASGSFRADSMIIVPCSTNTLSKIACGISDNLITRSASVMLKEKKKLILALRETPLSTIILENMHKLSLCGATIAPPVLGYYSNAQTLEDMENFLFGKWLDCLGIDNNLYKRWAE